MKGGIDSIMTYGNSFGGRGGGGGGGFRGGRGGGGGGFRGGGGGFRRDFGGPRTMHKITCSECGNEGEVPFKPREGTPVYCRDCFAKKNGRSPGSNNREGGNEQSGGESDEGM